MVDNVFSMKLLSRKKDKPGRKKKYLISWFSGEFIFLNTVLIKHHDDTVGCADSQPFRVGRPAYRCHFCNTSGRLGYGFNMFQLHIETIKN